MPIRGNVDIELSSTDEESNSQANPSKRQCRNQRINRLGISEDANDHNSFFENVTLPSNNSEDGSHPSDSEPNSNLIESADHLVRTDTSNNCETSPLSISHLVSLVTKLVIKVDEMQKQLAGIEAKINIIRDSNGAPGASGVIDIRKLSQFGLPVKNESELRTLESMLSNQIEKQELVNVLTSIGGTRGKSDGNKILETIVHKVIQPTFLPFISWSGRGRGNETKIALSKYVNIINLFSVVVNAADNKFDQSQTEKCLKYKIIKYAPAKFGERVGVKPANTTSDTSSDSSQHGQPPINSNANLITTSTNPNQSHNDQNVLPPMYSDHTNINAPPMHHNHTQNNVPVEQSVHHNTNYNNPPQQYQSHNIMPHNVLPNIPHTYNPHPHPHPTHQPVNPPYSQPMPQPMPQSNGSNAFQHAFNALNTVYENKDYHQSQAHQRTYQNL